MELIPQVLLSPYVIGVTIVIVVYGSMLAAVSRSHRIRKVPKLKKPAKVKKFTPDKSGLKKDEDISELGLE